MSKIHMLALKIGKRLSKHSSDNLKEQYTSEQLEQMIAYFFEVLIKDIFWIVPLIIISLKLNVFTITLIIMLTFLPIRLTFGGFHFESDLFCMITTVITPIILSYIALHLVFNLGTLIIIYTFAFGTIWIRGVVDNPKKQFSSKNKRLNMRLKNRFYKTGKLLIFLILVINIYLILNNYIIFSNAIALGVFAAFLVLFVSK